MFVDSLLGWLGSRVSAINHMCRVQICESVNGPLHETIKYHFNLTERQTGNGLSQLDQPYLVSQHDYHPVYQRVFVNQTVDG